MSSLGTASSDMPRRKLRSKRVTGTIGVLGADPARAMTLPSGAMSWIATTRWLVVKSALSRLSGELDRRASTMWLTLPAVASSTPPNNDWYRTVTNPPPAKASAKNTTIADTAAERAEMPKLGRRTERMIVLRRIGRTTDTPIV